MRQKQKIETLEKKVKLFNVDPAINDGDKNIITKNLRNDLTEAHVQIETLNFDIKKKEDNLDKAEEKIETLEKKVKLFSAAIHKLRNTKKL